MANNANTIRNRAFSLWLIENLLGLSSTPGISELKQCSINRKCAYQSTVILVPRPGPQSTADPLLAGLRFRCVASGHPLELVGVDSTSHRFGTGAFFWHYRNRFRYYETWPSNVGRPWKACAPRGRSRQ